MSFPPFFYAIQIAKNAAAATAAAIPFAQKQEKESRLSILFFCAITTAQDFILLPPLQQQANNYAGRMGNINSAFFFYSKALLYATEGERRRQFFLFPRRFAGPPIFPSSSFIPARRRTRAHLHYKGGGHQCATPGKRVEKNHIPCFWKAVIQYYMCKIGECQSRFSVSSPSLFLSFQHESSHALQASFPPLSVGGGSV